ncbi:MAG: hypothetical protein AVDCRST_MAG68-4665 [uncultured Gemmatimonadetes bacterium]|uniref:Uncharacterized protein n=1 Tax=uncultured Gemmatimonadota bacterium TaxID=203437 RepID=A0A6J4MPL6_9BACT|nr:MAG: hypothetical protein AVDCRST_MAG68-4665 [uncultured Gemmatimonadota bacterium]
MFLGSHRDTEAQRKRRRPGARAAPGLQRGVGSAEGGAGRWCGEDAGGYCGWFETDWSSGRWPPGQLVVSDVRPPYRQSQGHMARVR